MKLSIRLKQIILFSLLALIISVAVSYISYTVSSDILMNEVNNKLQSNAFRLAETYESWLQIQIRQLEVIGNFIELDYSEELKSALVVEAERIGFNSIALADKQGFLHLKGGGLVDLSQREYLKRVFSTKSFTVSDPVYSAIEGEENLLTVLFAVPIIKNNEVEAVLIGQKDAQFLNENINKINYGENSSNYILSTNGTIIAHTFPQEAIDQLNLINWTSKNKDKEINRTEDLTVIAKKMVAGEVGIGSYPWNETFKFVAYAPIPSLGWSVATSIPIEIVEAPLVKIGIVSIFTILGSLILGVILAYIISNTLSNPILKVAKSIKKLSTGDADLTKRIDVTSSDELGELANDVNLFLNNLHSIISTLKGSQNSLTKVGSELTTQTQETASAINQILANINSVKNQSSVQSENSENATKTAQNVSNGIKYLDDLIENQVNGSAEASSSIEEMVGNIVSVTNSITKMSEKFSILMEASATGKLKQEGMGKRVAEIAMQSETLLEANKAIATIASRTNLLAMNAAIEAAHAGDAGKGFSVVADEIRKLAETSSTQSSRIKEELVSIKNAITEVVDVSKDSEKAFISVSSEIDSTEILVKQIEAAMLEQKVGSNQVLEALRNMNDIGSDVKEKASEMRGDMESVLDAIYTLAETSSIILSSMDEMSTGSQMINESTNLVAEMAEETNINIKDMDEVIGRFKV